MKIKLIISDIDGVWTDGGMYYSNAGVESKKFNTSDSVGVLLSKKANLEVVVMSGEDEKCVHDRMEKLKIKTFYLGVKDKLELAQRILIEKKLSFKEVAFIGDEINDLKLLNQVGFSGCPLDAPSYTKEIVDVITSSKGGEGAFKEFVFQVFKYNNIDPKDYL